jgi:hypothetical protein
MPHCQCCRKLSENCQCCRKLSKLSTGGGGGGWGVVKI